MICVQVGADGALQVVTPQPVEVAACGLVVVSGSEAASSPFAISPEQGSQIGGAVLLVWGLAYVFRLVIRAFSIDEVRNEE